MAPSAPPPRPTPGGPSPEPPARRLRRALAALAGLLALAALGRAGLRLARSDLAVLCLHGIEDPDPRYAPWTLTREQLVQVLDLIQASGRRPLRIAEVGPWLRGRGGPAGRGGVLLSFDDGRASDRDLVLPELARRGLPACFFVPSDGRSRQLDDAALRAMAAAGLDLGCHSRTHARFARHARESPEQYGRRLAGEVDRARRELEATLGGPVTAFAYPSGEFPPEAVDQVRRAGFELAFTTEYGRIAPGADPLRLPRFMLSADTPPEAVAEYLEGDRTFLLAQLALALGVLAGAAHTWRRLAPPRERPDGLAGAPALPPVDST